MIDLMFIDILILDDFAFEPMSKEESKYVREVFLKRIGRVSMIISSKRDAAEWLAMVENWLVANGAIDRPKNAAYDFVTEGESSRRGLNPTLNSSDLPPSPLSTKTRLRPRARARHQC
jgi:DNA replication protein DnaC